MLEWEPYSHKISDVLEWKDDGRLELAPDYQRRTVWNESANVMLIDSVLQNIPIPKIFIKVEMRDKRAYRSIIDGQQRMRAILNFMDDEFSLKRPYNGPHLGKKFSELDEDVQNTFLKYRLDFNELNNPTDEQVRDVYSRVNKYLVKLNSQELRKAEYPGKFYSVCNKLSLDDFFDSSKIFNSTHKKRSLDVEYISELMAGLIAGPQDKKLNLDEFYQDYMEWPDVGARKKTDEFRDVLNVIRNIFAYDDAGISQTRFRQKSDFYSLFLAVSEFNRKGLTIEGKELASLQADLQLLDKHIRPESSVRILSEYAVKCVSQANSVSSRTWRMALLRSVLQGTFNGAPPVADDAQNIFQLVHDLSVDRGVGFLPPKKVKCPISDKQIDIGSSDFSVAWRKDCGVFQMSNSSWVSIKDADQDGGWHVLSRGV